jgi:predicted GIY-YIG superfamily endonuclease
MFYVYLLISIADPDQRYVGFTTDVKRRVKSHNEGASVHTRKYKPWKLVSYFALDTNAGRASSNTI